MTVEQEKCILEGDAGRSSAGGRQGDPTSGGEGGICRRGEVRWWGLRGMRRVGRNRRYTGVSRPGGSALSAVGRGNVWLGQRPLRKLRE